MPGDHVKTVDFGPRQYKKFRSTEAGTEFLTYSLYSKCLWAADDAGRAFLKAEFASTFLKGIESKEKAMAVVDELYELGKVNYNKEQKKNEEQDGSSSSHALSAELKRRCEKLASAVPYNPPLTCFPRTVHKALYSKDKCACYVFAVDKTVFYACPVATADDKQASDEPQAGVFNGLCLEMEYQEDPAQSYVAKTMDSFPLLSPYTNAVLAYCTCSVDIDNRGKEAFPRFIELKSSTLFMQTREEMVKKAKPSDQQRIRTASDEQLREKELRKFKYQADMQFGPGAGGEVHVGFIQRPTGDKWHGKRRPGPTNIEIYRYPHEWFKQSFGSERKRDQWGAYATVLRKVHAAVLQETPSRTDPTLLQLSYGPDGSVQVTKGNDAKAQAIMEAVSAARARSSAAP